MNKAEVRLTDTKDDGSQPISEQAGPTAHHAHQVRARRLGLLLMLISSLIMLGALVIAWIMIGRIL